MPDRDDHQSDVRNVITTVNVLNNDSFKTYGYTAPDDGIGEQ
jgi:hypothetical protein